MIRIVKKSITRIEVDAVVNAANERLAQGSGVCGYIFRDAGEREMNEACRAIGHCDTGSAVITPGFRLPAKYVIHTVGPIWNGGRNGEEAQLSSCYRKSLELAAENHCSSIAFPLISSGIYGYPVGEAWSVALQSCLEYEKQHEACPDIFFCVLSDDMKEMGEKILADLMVD